MAAIDGISNMNYAGSNASVSSARLAAQATKDVNVQPDSQTAVNTAVTGKTYQEKSGQLSGEENENSSGRQPSERAIKQAVADINKKINHNTIASFGYHEETNRVVIKIVDKDTKEVIKELPPEKTLEMIAKAWELAGLLIDEKK